MMMTDMMDYENLNDDWLEAENERLEQQLDTIQRLFSEMIDTAKAHGNRINMENSAYADLYKLLGMSEYRAVTKER